jgi:hypothetical protein
MADCIEAAGGPIMTAPAVGWDFKSSCLELHECAAMLGEGGEIPLKTGNRARPSMGFAHDDLIPQRNPKE